MREVGDSRTDGVCRPSEARATTFQLEEDLQVSNTTIELLQLADFKTSHVIQCKIEIRRTIYHCGMFSHLGPVENGLQEYLYDISAEQCKFIHNTGIFKYDNFHTIANIKINETKTVGIDLAGKIEGKSCSGGTYADDYGSWDNVLVQGLIKITLIEEYAKVNLNNNKLHLNSGTTCKFSDEHCIDAQAGYAFWSHVPNENCFDNKYNVLFKGTVTKTLSPNQEVMYTINTYDISFSLNAVENIKFCDRIITKTEHPKLFIYEKTNVNVLFDNDVRQQQDLINIDIFAYTNAKFVHVEKHFRAQFKSLYLNILTKMCELERKEIQNSLSLTSNSPDEFAYNVMQKPGYIARLAGEAVHIVKCTPINVKIQHIKECYEELPVISGNTTWFLTPKTHILIRTGTQIECDSIIPPYYKIDNSWISLTPTPRKIEKNITVFHPKIIKNWTPEKLNSLATSGIYTQQDLEKFEERLLFPMEKKSIMNTIAKFTQSANSAKDDLMNNFLTEKTLTHIAESTWNKLLEKYEEYGTISSGIIMTLIIIQLTKMVVDMIIRGYTLKKLYGCSSHLLGSIFTSVTHLLVVLNKINDNRTTNSKNEGKMANELQEVVITKPIISMPVRRKHNPGTQEEHELQELKSRKIVKFRPLPPPPPPLPSSPPIVTSPTRITSVPQKETELSLFAI